MTLKLLPLLKKLTLNRPPHLRIFSVIPLCALLGCSSLYVRSADREVGKLIKKAEAKVNEERHQSWAVAEQKIEEMSEAGADLADPDSNEDSSDSEEMNFGTPENPLKLTLEDCLELAIKRSRDYRSRQESVYLIALSLTLERYRWTPQPFATANAQLDPNREKAFSSFSNARVDAGAGFQQRLPLGGDVTVSGNVNYFEGFLSQLVDTESGTIRVDMVQPILKGAGHRVAWESLKQSERDLIYELRSFELFREDFTIDIATRYYGLMRQRQFVENAHQNYESFEYLHKRSKSYFDVGMGTAIDAFRAEQEELQSRDNWISEQERYDFDLDSFKIQLGLPTDACIELVEVELTYEPLGMKMKQALITALESRLDLKTARDRLEDARRRVEIAKNALLPGLDVSASYVLNSMDGRHFTAFDGKRDGELFMGFNIELPLNRKAERNALKSALITYDRALRQYTLTEDQIKQQVRNTLRSLRRAASTIAIQEKSIELAKRRLKNADYLFKEGKLSNRDYVEAQQASLDAKNSYIQALVTYNIAKLTVKRDIGALEIDEKGRWVK